MFLQQITWFYANDLAAGASFLAAVGLEEVPHLIQREKCRIFHATSVDAGFLGVCNSRAAPTCASGSHGDAVPATFTLVAPTRAAVDALHTAFAPLNGTRLALTSASGSATWGAYGFNFYDLNYTHGLGCYRFEVQSFDDPAWPQSGRKAAARAVSNYPRAATASAPLRQDLFVPTARYPCFRQPAILATSSGWLLAFAENRNVSACAPNARALDGAAVSAAAARGAPNEIGSLLVRRSADGGATWGPLETVVSGDVDFYTIVDDAATRVQWLFVQARTETLVFNSTDDGATWSEPANFFEAWPAVVLPPGMSGARPAVGHGIQLSGGANEERAAESNLVGAGRLVLPMVCTNATAVAWKGDTSCMACNSCVLFSDDHGVTWAFGGVAQQGSRESQLVETAMTPVGPRPAAHLRSEARASALYVNARNLGATPGHRMVAHSEDGGETLGGFAIDRSLVTPVTAHWTGVVASVVGVGGGEKKEIVYAGASNAAERKTMSLRRSADGGKSWGVPRVLWPGPAAYSDLARVNATHVAVIFENGDSTFADRVSVSVVPLDWIDRGSGIGSDRRAV
jgi:sialidase-1